MFSHHPPPSLFPMLMLLMYRSSFPASPPSRTPPDLQQHENALHFGAGVSAGAAPATASTHIAQGTRCSAPMQPPSFNSSPDMWHSVGSSPVTPTATTGEKGSNSKGVVRRSPTDSTRGNSRYDPVQGRPQHRGMARSGPASESLTDEGEEERDSDGSVRDVRDKKRRYAKTFRDTEKHLFEKLRHRLFPQDPHAKRSECLERGASASFFFHRISNSKTSTPLLLAPYSYREYRRAIAAP